MSQIKVDTITDGAGTGAPSFPNGLGVADGTAAAPSITNTGDLNTGILFPAADTVAVTTGGSERLRVDSSGNVGIGTTSPDFPLDVSSTGVGSTTVSRFYVTDNTVGLLRVGNSTTGDGATAPAFGANATSAVIHTNNTERMRIDSSGAVTIANLAGTGSRAVNASATGVLSATSDSRLKEEVPEASIPSLAEVMLLKPRAYKWLDDIEKRGEDAAVEIGFFADEVKDIIPSAAPMGNDGYYGFYDRSVIAALTRAIQEQQALIAALIARVSALENTAN